MGKGPSPLGRRGGVAVVVDDVRPEGEVSRFEFPAMRVAEVALSGDIELEQRALDWLFGTWLPQIPHTKRMRPMVVGLRRAGYGYQARIGGGQRQSPIPSRKSRITKMAHRITTAARTTIFIMVRTLLRSLEASPHNTATSPVEWPASSQNKVARTNTKLARALILTVD